jgi:hypothetical protein
MNEPIEIGNSFLDGTYGGDRSQTGLLVYWLVQIYCTVVLTVGMDTIYVYGERLARSITRVLYLRVGW